MEQEETERTEYRLFLCCRCFLLFKMPAGRQEIGQMRMSDRFNKHQRDAVLQCLRPSGLGFVYPTLAAGILLCLLLKRYRTPESPDGAG